VVPHNILARDVILALFSYVAKREAKLNPDLPQELSSFNKTPRKAPGPKPGEFVNRAGIPVFLGSRREGRTRFYCNRSLGSDVIPDSDGTCGPNDGPQCPDCKAFVPVNLAGAPVSTPSGSIRFYCGRTIGKGTVTCGPSRGPQCQDCKTFQRTAPRYGKQNIRSIRRK